MEVRCGFGYWSVLAALLGLVSSGSCTADLRDGMERIEGEGWSEGESTEEVGGNLDHLVAPTAPQNAEPADDTVASCPTGQTPVPFDDNRNIVKNTIDDACIVTLGGSDFVINKSRTAATILAGSGHDLVVAGKGDTLVAAGPGFDIVIGKHGNDEIYGQAHGDILYGGGGADTIVGGLGMEYLRGGGGADTIVPGPGRDTVNAGSGADTVIVYDVCELESGEVLNGGFGENDTLVIPVDLATLQGLGVTATSFENVVVAADPEASQCSSCVCKVDAGNLECCSGNGACGTPVANEPNLVTCGCDASFGGPACSFTLGGMEPLPLECQPGDIWCEDLPFEMVWTDDVNLNEFRDEECDVEPWLKENIPDDATFDVSLVVCPGEDGCVKDSNFPLVVWGNASGGTHNYYGYLQSLLARAGIASFSVQLGDKRPFEKAAMLVCWHRLIRTHWEHADGLADAYAFGGHSSSGAGAGLAAVFVNSLSNPTDRADSLRTITSVSPNPYSFFDVDFGFSKGVLTGAQLPAALNIGHAFESDRSTVNQALKNYDWLGREVPAAGAKTMRRASIWTYGFDDGLDESHFVWGGKPDPGGHLGGGGPQGRALGSAYIGGFLRWQLADEDEMAPLFRSDFFTPTISAFYQPGSPDIFQQYSEGYLDLGRRLVVDAFEGEDDINELGEVVDYDGFDLSNVGEANDVSSPHSQFLPTGLVRLRWSQPGVVSETFGGPLNLQSYSHVSLRVGIPFVTDELGECAPLNSSDIEIRVTLADDQSNEPTVMASDFGRLANADFATSATLNNPKVPGQDCYAANFMRTIRIPMSEFCQSGFDVTAATELRVELSDATPGEILLDSLEFTRSKLDDPSDFCVPPEVCGDGVASPGEECDGLDLKGLTCENFGLTGPLGCHTDTCILDKSRCVPDEPPDPGYPDCNGGADGTENCPCLEVDAIPPYEGEGGNPDGVFGQQDGKYFYCPGPDLVCGSTLKHEQGQPADGLPICRKCGTDPGNTNEGCPCDVVNGNCESRIGWDPDMVCFGAGPDWVQGGPGICWDKDLVPDHICIEHCPSLHGPGGFPQLCVHDQFEGTPYDGGGPAPFGPHTAHCAAQECPPTNFCGTEPGSEDLVCVGPNTCGAECLSDGDCNGIDTPTNGIGYPCWYVCDPNTARCLPQGGPDNWSCPPP